METNGKKSAFKMLFWEDQMIKIAQYLRFGTYPFDNMGREKKRDFRRISKGYKIVDEHLHKEVVVKRVGKDDEGESKNHTV